MRRSEADSEIRKGGGYRFEKLVEPYAVSVAELVHFLEALGVFVLALDFVVLVEVAVDVLTEERDLLNAIVGEHFDFREDAVYVAAPFPAPCEGDDAEGAHVVAPSHD